MQCVLLTDDPRLLPASAVCPEVQPGTGIQHGMAQEGEHCFYWHLAISQQSTLHK